MSDTFRRRAGAPRRDGGPATGGRDVLELIAELVPPAIGVALSPLPLIAVVLMILSPDGRGRSILFAVGRVGAVLAVVVVMAVLSELNTRGEGGSRIGAIIRLVLGAAFIVLGILKLRSRAKAGAEPEAPGWMQAIESMPPKRTLRIGFLISAVNPKEVIFSITAGVVIGSASVPPGQMAAATGVYVLIATVTVVTPVAAYLVFGDRTRSWLRPFQTWLVRYYAAIIAAVLFILGGVMIGNAFGDLQTPPNPLSAVPAR